MADPRDKKARDVAKRIIEREHQTLLKLNSGSRKVRVKSS